MHIPFVVGSLCVLSSGEWTSETSVLRRAGPHRSPLSGFICWMSLRRAWHEWSYRPDSLFWLSVGRRTHDKLVWLNESYDIPS